VTAVARGAAGGGDGCKAVVVTSADPADVVDTLQHDPKHRPDVWIPDSSTWAVTAKLPAGTPARGRSIARSPLVLAVPTQLAQRLGSTGRRPDVPALVAAAGGGGRAVLLRWTLADPSASPASAAAVLALRDAAAASGDRGALTRVLRGCVRARSVDIQASLARGAAASAVPSSEQAVWTVNATGPHLTAVYPGSGQRSLDYPLVVLSTDAGRRARAAVLERALGAGPARALLQAAGFRDPRGAAGRTLSPERGVNPDAGGIGLPLSQADLTSAADVLAAIRRPSRLLVVVDVSGSMAEPAGGSAGSRLGVALAAAMGGLALYPDDTEVGLWEFATNLSPHADYRQLVPVVPLGQGPDGSLGRDRIATALQSVRADPNGNTGLYDTALAAVRALRSRWDPSRQNTVVLLTDGHNDDAHGLSLPTVLRVLRAENDPGRPVPLVGLAYGKDSDQPALSAMSAATGGVTYRVDSADQVRAVMLDAIARRPGTANG
jgi:Ca-activated chloride channel family protein